jgi:class 3 adenylate cyclase
MNRKIAAIMAADVAGYSKLVGEDEEETLRRLASYRTVFDDFIARSSGRVFNTAGDAILAEFPSAVEAMRCAIDIQESLRTRNLAYPPSRQMNFRIGMTIGDVVERDGDLLGDGVNIAARLEGLATPGGICVSRTIYEQVANKMSVKFADIGEQEVKNIASPIHAYTVALGFDGEGGQRPAKRPKRAIAMWPLIASLAAGVALIIAAGLYLSAVQIGGPTPVVVQNSAPPLAQGQAAAILVPEAVPFISDRDRATIRSAYLAAQDHKALAISLTQIGFITGQNDDQTAKAAALDKCQKTTIAGGRPEQRCELYALGNAVVYLGGRPPLPPEPWLIRDSSIERPFVAKNIPLVSDNLRAEMTREYEESGKYSKALAISPRGTLGFYRYQPSSEEAMRRALESCGNAAGVPCTIVAVDDRFVVPIPTIMKTVGFFHPSADTRLTTEAREDVVRRLGNARSGWNAVAVGAAGRPGSMLKAATEQGAIDGALAECVKQDRDCRVIAIGPFTVEPAAFTPSSTTFAQQVGQFGTADEAKAMLMKAVAAVKADKAKALEMFNKGRGGFLDRDLYPACVNVSDGKLVANANPNAQLGTDSWSLKDSTGKPYGTELYAAAQKPEGQITEVSYMFPKPVTDMTPVPKVSFVTRVGDLICLVGYYNNDDHDHR